MTHAALVSTSLHPSRVVVVLRRWAAVALLLASATACASKSGDESGANAFASYWADCTAYCQQQASCGIQDEAQCTAVCSTPVELTTAAIASANLASDDLRRCEDAWKLSDSCNAGLSCANLMASQSSCSVQQSAAQNNCSLVMSAIDLYARAHPATPFFGAYAGTYDGSESGSLSGVITSWGRLVATIDSPSFGMVPTVGTIKGADLAIQGQAPAPNAATTLSFSATLQGSAVADAGPSAFTASGTWKSNVGGSGTFMIQSN